MEIYGVNYRIQSEYRKIRTRKNSLFGHFSRSEPATLPENKFFSLIFLNDVAKILRNFLEFKYLTSSIAEHFVNLKNKNFRSKNFDLFLKLLRISMFKRKFSTNIFRVS